MKELLPKDLTIKEYLFAEILDSVSDKDLKPKFWEDDARSIAEALHDTFQEFDFMYDCDDNVETLQAHQFIALKFTKKYIVKESPSLREHKTLREKGFTLEPRFKWDIRDLRTLLCDMLNSLYPHER